MSRDTAIEDRIEELVRQHGSFRAASAAVGISFPYLCRLKCGNKGNPSDEVLRKLGLQRHITTTYTRTRKFSRGPQR